MKAVALTTLFIAASAVAQPRATTPVEGYWKNPIGSAIIQIAPCGDTLCIKKFSHFLYHFDLYCVPSAFSYCIL